DRSITGGNLPQKMESLQFWIRPVILAARQTVPTADILTRRVYGEQAEDQGQRPCSFGHGVARYAAAVRPAQRAPPARTALRLRSRAMRGLLGAPGRQGNPLVRHSGGGRERQGNHDARGPAGSL